MDLIHVSSGQWRHEASRALEQGAASRSPVVLQRDGKPTFVVYCIPPMSRPDLQTERQRLALIASAHLDLDLRSKPTEPPLWIKVSDLRRYLAETLSKIIFDARPAILTKFGIPIGLLQPTPYGTEWETVQAISEEFYQ
jgi:hypothetical protein